MHERISVTSINFPGADFATLSRHWRDLGATRGSIVSLMLDSEPVEQARRALREADCQLETVVHPFMPGQPLELDEASWRAPRQRLDRALDAAAELGARSVYLTTGGHGSGTWEDSARAFAEAVAPGVARARELGLQLMIENAPALYADLHIAHSLRDTLTLAEMADVGVCIDLYFCWAEAGLQESIRRAMPRCGLVQVSDYVLGDRALPARAVAGDGVIPLQRIIGWLLEAGYEGSFDLELIGPRIDREGPLEATRRTAAKVTNILRGFGV